MQHFSNVIVIAPNRFVLDETRKASETSACYKTYASLCRNSEPATNYDLIVLDEFHRAGADEWNKGVLRLLELNPNAYVLGTSATNIRYLDGARDMAAELFDGHIVSRLSLKEAIDAGILPSPVYVSSMYSIEETVHDYSEKIEKSVMSREDKDACLERLRGIQNSWEQSDGIPQILRKYLSGDIRKIIVFSPSVETAESAVPILTRWFTAASMHDMEFITIHSKVLDNSRRMEQFAAPCDAGHKKVLVSVNMLNEGVHVPDVDAIIMMRNSISPAIIQQQVGRCLTCSHVHKAPVILDLVNNLAAMLTYSIAGGVLQVTANSTEHGAAYAFPFTIIDAISDITSYFMSLDELTSLGLTWELHLREHEAFYAKYHKLPDDKINRRWRSNCRAYIHKGRFDQDFVSRCKLIGITPQERKTRWYELSKEECVRIASGYTTREKFSVKASAAYRAAKTNGWLDDCCAHMPPKKIGHSRTKEECVNIARQYSMRSEFRNQAGTVYLYAKRHGWLNDCLAHMEDADYRLPGKWNDDNVVETAKSCCTMEQFHKRYGGAYEYASRHGLLDKCRAVVSHYTMWNREMVFEVAEQCINCMDMRARFSGAAAYAARHGFWAEVVTSRGWKSGTDPSVEKSRWHELGDEECTRDQVKSCDGWLGEFLAGMECGGYLPDSEKTPT